MKKLKKIITIIIIVTLMFGQNLSAARALEAPTAPEAPVSSTNTEVAPEAPTVPESPSSDSNVQKEEESVSAAPIAPSNPTVDNSRQTKETSAESENTTSNNNEGEQSANNTSNNPANTESELKETDGNGNVGDTTILTGDATNDANLETLANNNLSTNIDNSTGTKIVNTGNGSGSENSGSSTSVSNSNSTQNNNASVGNNLDQSTTTGKNDASYNVGNSTIQTGDANTTGTILTGVNSNIEGVSVSEFEVADVHTGDLVLDFAANCIINCNGTSNSGDNDASYNTNGDSSIETGNANVSANALTFANNNLSGNVIYGVVDIFGTLIGDIILPDLAVIEAGTCSLCNQSNVLAANTNNGANSDNNANVDSTTNNTAFQTNEANIENNLILSSTTGNNDANRNTGGQTNIETGDSSIDANIVNIVNSNIEGGNWNLRYLQYWRLYLNLRSQYLSVRRYCG